MSCPIELTDTEICRKRGDTWAIEIVVKNKTTGLPEDITGNTFILSVSTEDAPTAEDYLFQSTGSIIVAEDGTVTFPINAAAADNLGYFYFDIEMLAGAIKTTIMGGQYILHQDITK